jgi:hypothetical protein
MPCRGGASSAPPGSSPGAKGPRDERDDQDAGKPVPGQRVLQVIVGQGHHELAGLGQSARRYRAFLLD